jgi:methionyl-tRNA formyltransferase
MKILYLGYPENSIHSFLQTKGTVFQTQEKISFEVNQFDWIISYGYSHIIKQDVIDSAKNSIINLHISYLPYNRGADPNFWSWLENTPKGVTIHQIDKGIDTGDIFIQKEIKFEETANIEVFCSYKNKKATATFNPSTTKIFYKGKLYDSPSAAAQAVKIDNGAPENVTENGWTFWKYLDDTGMEKKINELRK